MSTNGLTDVAARLGLAVEDVEVATAPTSGVVRRPVKVVIGESYIEAPIDPPAAELARAFERAAALGYRPLPPEVAESELTNDGHQRILLVPGELASPAIVN